jgi:hypothetical protein
MLSKVDVDNSGTLSLPEFNSLFDVVRLRTVFDSIDRDGSGMISSREMAGALRQLGAPCTPADARRLLSSVDRNSDGEVSWDEFRDTFRYTPLADLQACPPLSLRVWTPASKVTESSGRAVGRGAVGRAARHRPWKRPCGCAPSPDAWLRGVSRLHSSQETSKRRFAHGAPAV